MTKWARLRRRKERMKAEEALRGSKADEKEVKLTEPEKISENINILKKLKNLIALKPPNQTQFFLKFLDMLTC